MKKGCKAALSSPQSLVLLFPDIIVNTQQSWIMSRAVRAPCDYERKQDNTVSSCYRLNGKRVRRPCQGHCQGKSKIRTDAGVFMACGTYQ